MPDDTIEARARRAAEEIRNLVYECDGCGVATEPDAWYRCIDGRENNCVEALRTYIDIIVREMKGIKEGGK